jgi:signal transduction histidine kinase
MRTRLAPQPNARNWAWWPRRLTTTRLLGVLAAAGVEIILIGGSSAATHELGKRALDPLAYVLLLLAGAAVVGSRRWPIAAFGSALATVLVYAGLNYPTDGPIFLVVPVTLYSTVSADAPWRTIVFVGLATLALVAAYGPFNDGSVPVDARTLGVPLWMGAVALVAHLMSRRARETELLRRAEAQHLLVEERLRIARELHDVVSHSISMINVQAGVAAHVLDQQPEQAREALLAIKSASKEALRELRGILGLLREVDAAEPYTPAPGLAQLPALIEATTRAGLATRLCVHGQPRGSSALVELTAYRIVQEALTNTLRYAGPASATVDLSCADGCLLVEVTDDGPGAADATPGTGTGIVGMRERVQAVGGVLEIGALQSGGFRVFARLPLETGAEA